MILIPLDPVGSNDVYRYIWDGKVQSAGINPYKYAPLDSQLNFLRSDSQPPKFNFPHLKTIYFPFSEMIFFAAYKISGESIWGIKIFLFLFELITILMISLILKKLNLPRKNILYYVLCPLPIFQFFVDGHIDAVGASLIIAAIYFFISNKKISAFILLGLSLSIKPTGLLLIPIIFFTENKLRERLHVLIIPPAVSGILFLPYLFGVNPFEALENFAANWTFNGVVFNLLNSYFDYNQKTRIICAVLLIIAYALVLLSKKVALQKIYLSMFLLLIFSPVVHPWYVAWLAVLVPVAFRWSGLFFISLISLTSITIMNYELGEAWKEYPVVLFVEYAPVLIFFIYEMIKESSQPFFTFSEKQ
ncbi:MAG: hypothetical protein V1720_03775 [bacterium]